MNDSVIVLCIKTVHMNGSGPVAFISGSIYQGRRISKRGYNLIDERKKDHGAGGDWFDEHFILISESFNVVCKKDLHVVKRRVFTKGRTYGVYPACNEFYITNDNGVRINLSPTYIHDHFKVLRGSNG